MDINNNLTIEAIEKWEELELKELLLKGIYAEGFDAPSFIQKTAIRPILLGKDLRAQAQSGTGKTGAFSIGALQIVQGEGTQVLILASTREIALQNYEVLKSFSKFMDKENESIVSIQLLSGGKSVLSDIEGLKKKPNIIVGTPGRILHMIEKNYIQPKDKLLFIIDEADELFKRGFQDTIKKIFMSFDSKILQVAMFSATWEEEELEVSKKLMKNDAVIIDLRQEEQTLKGIDQYFVSLGDKKSAKGLNDEIKVKVLLDIFSKNKISQSIIFVNGIERVKQVYNQLNTQGFACDIMHSLLTQPERETAIKRFKNGETRTLVASNLIGRGVDIQQLSVVVNFDIPRDSFATYIHRIGRVGRYGRKGVAINLINSDEEEVLQSIASHYRTSIMPLPGELNLK